MNIYAIKKPSRINSVSITLLVVVALGGYLAYWWVPILWPVFQMTGMMKTACGEAYRGSDDKTVMKKLVADAARTKWRIDERNFRFRRIPYTRRELKTLKIDEDGAVARRGKHCEVDFYYEDDFPIPFTGKTMRLTFERSVDAPLEPVKYDKLCTCVSVPGGPAGPRAR